MTDSPPRREGARPRRGRAGDQVTPPPPLPPPAAARARPAGPPLPSLRGTPGGSGDGGGDGERRDTRGGRKGGSPRQAARRGDGPGPGQRRRPPGHRCEEPTRSPSGRAGAGETRAFGLIPVPGRYGEPAADRGEIAGDGTGRLPVWAKARGCGGGGGHGGGGGARSAGTVGFGHSVAEFSPPHTPLPPGIIAARWGRGNRGGGNQ